MWAALALRDAGAESSFEEGSTEVSSLAASLRSMILEEAASAVGDGRTPSRRTPRFGGVEGRRSKLSEGA